MSDFRMYAIVNREAVTAAGGNRGKMLAQAGHAFLHAWWEAFADLDHPENMGAAALYKNSGAAVKIVLEAADKFELHALHALAIEASIPASLVIDRATTVFREPTVTFLGLGPIRAEHAPEWLRKLKVFI